MALHAVSFEEKTMAPKSRLFQTNFSTASLRSTALAIVLIVLASPVRAAPVTLSCRVGEGSDTVTLRINYETGLVEQLGPSGAPYTNRIAPNARISDNAIVWSVQLLDTGLQTPVPMIWGGTIDRLSGTGWEEWSREPDLWNVQRTNLTCREVTKPKF